MKNKIKGLYIFIILVICILVIGFVSLKNRNNEKKLDTENVKNNDIKVESYYCPKYDEEDHMDSMNKHIVTYNESIDLYKENIKEAENIDRDVAKKILNNIEGKSDEISKLVIPDEYDMKKKALAAAFESLEFGLKHYNGYYSENKDENEDKYNNFITKSKDSFNLVIK